MLKPSVEVKHRDGILLAEFWDCHRLDPNPVTALRTHFESHVQAGGKPVVVIDMRGVGYAGSTALGGFVALRRKGARVIFHQVEPTVVEVFRVSQLLSLFSFADSEAEALALAAGSPPAGTLPPTAGSTDESAPPVAPPASPMHRRPSAPPLRRSRPRSDGAGPTG